jgi:dinuclear metal center YbgI/SA1388 family protein
MTHLADIAAYLDRLLDTSGIPDYPGALNGIQFANRAPVRAIAAAVDVSRRVLEHAVAAGANLVLVHHGMFWGGAQRVIGPAYERTRLLVEHDVAVYASHLPLDAHPTFGNNVLLAKALGLEPTQGFARYKTIDIGVRGESDIDTAELFRRADALARSHGGGARGVLVDPGRRTRRWGICTGAGASSETLQEAQAFALDTLIVGEGPHHTAVAAGEADIAVIYAGHYATETLGVSAIAEHLTATFGIPSTFIDAPTGL